MKRKHLVVVAIITLSLVMLGLLVELIYFRGRLINSIGNESISYNQYSYHYVLISDSQNSTFWKNVCDGANAYANKHDAYVDIMGEGLAVNYTQDQLLEIAIESKVDGIIVEGRESVKQTELINKAVASGIPVVTMLNDNFGSQKNAFIGIGYYDLGMEYARTVIGIANKSTRKVLILGDDLTEGEEGTSQSLFYNGFKSTLSNEGNHLNMTASVVKVNNSNSVSSQQTIKEILQGDELPDIIVCTNENVTVNIKQAIVDRNLVGKVRVIGYNNSSDIIDGIDKGIIDATVVFDATEMGQISAEALNDFHEYGHVNGYITVEAEIVNRKNIEEYKKEETYEVGTEY